MPNGPETTAKNFFVLPADVHGAPPGETAPAQNHVLDMKPNKVEAYIDGASYFKAIDEEITQLLASSAAGRFFYMHAWWLGLRDVRGAVNISVGGDLKKALFRQFPQAAAEWQVNVNLTQFKMSSANDARSMLTRLQEMQDRGVDVRVMAWVSPFLAKYQEAAQKAPGILHLNFHSLLSVQALRHPSFKMADKVMLNMQAHPLGGSHFKMFVCGDNQNIRAYVSGLDPQEGRLRPVANFLQAQSHPGWHDVGVKVVGKAADGVYDFFRSLWNAQRQSSVESFFIDREEIKSHLSTTTVVPARSTAFPIPDIANAKSYCQVLRTVPQMNFSFAGPAQFPGNSVMRWAMTTAAGFKRAPISFAKNGLFEFKVALKKAISKAEKYIFIADQAFSGLEIMDWINARMKQKPDLKVILLHGADPADPPSGNLHEAVNNHLTHNLPGTFFDFFSLSSAFVKNIAFYNWANVAVHCKVTIIDDKYCIIGTANCMRRSLYTDVELAVSIVDGADPSFVKTFRRDMWCRYCGVLLQAEDNLVLFADDRAAMLDLDRALGVWDGTWGARPGGVKLMDNIQRRLVPFAGAPPVAFNQQGYDNEDPDSRQKF